MPTRHLCLFFFVLAFLGNGPSFAQITPMGNEIVAASFGHNDSTDIAYDNQGGWTFVWTRNITNPIDLRILGRRYDEAGNALGPEFPISSTTGTHIFPEIDSDGLGNSVVVWTNDRSVILGQRLDPSGELIGEEFTVYTDAKENSHPHVAMADEGSFVVVWENGSSSNAESDIWGRLFDADGLPITEAFPINLETAGRQWRPRVKMNSDGSFLAAWSHDQWQAPDRISARRFDRSGAPIDEVELQLSESADVFIQLGLDLASGPMDGLYAVRVDIDLSGGPNVVFQGYNASGAPLTDEIVLDTRTSDTSIERARIATDTAGNSVVSWTACRFGPIYPGGPWDTVCDLSIAHLDASGTLTEPPMVMDRSDLGYGSRTSVAVGPNGRFAVAWTGEGGTSSQPNPVLGQLFTSTDAALVGHWPLDEGVGIDTVNSAGNGLDGVLEEGTLWTIAQRNSGAAFDGIDDLIRVADNGLDSPIDITEALTIALWVRPDALDKPTPQALVSKDNAYEFEIGREGPGEWGLRLDNLGAATSSTLLEEGIWQHLAATWDGSNVRLYLNGQLESSHAFTATLIPNDEDLGFGARPAPPWSGGPALHFEGALDEIHIFHRTLSSGEVEQLMEDSFTDTSPPLRSDFSPNMNLPYGTTVATLFLNTDEKAECRYDTSFGVDFDDMSGTFPFSSGTSHSADVQVFPEQVFFFAVRCRDELGNTHGDDELIVFGVGGNDPCYQRVSTWRFDSGSGCSAADASGSNPGTLGPNCDTNAPLWTEGHLTSDGALDFDGGDDLVLVPNSPSLASPTAITLSAWIRDSETASYRSLIDMRDSTEDGYDLYLDFQSRPLLRINEHTVTGSGPVSDDKWHHLLGTYDGSTLRLYVDGVLDASANVGPSSIDVSAPLKIGHHYSSTPDFSFAGKLSQVTLWNRALNPVDVLEHFSNRGVLSCPD